MLNKLPFPLPFPTYFNLDMINALTSDTLVSENGKCIQYSYELYDLNWYVESFYVSIECSVKWVYHSLLQLGKIKLYLWNIGSLVKPLYLFYLASVKILACFHFLIFFKFSFLALTFSDLGLVPRKVKGYPVEYLIQYRKGGPNYGSTASEREISEYNPWCLILNPVLYFPQNWKLWK